MGKKLRSISTHIISLIAVFILCTFASGLNAQIAITDKDRFEVAFTVDQSSVTGQSVVISVSEIERFLGEGYARSFEPLESREGNTPNFYVSDIPGRVALHGIMPENSSQQIFSSLAFINRTDAEFSALNVAFDFLYDAAFETSFTLELHYRVDDNPWREVPNGVISSSNLQTGQNSWQSFSIQSRIDNLFVRESDIVEFEWRITSGAVNSGQIPLAMQQIELNPVQSSVRPPERGSLVITEILPSAGETGGIEFIEIYNVTENSIPIKGMEIATSYGSVVIQDEVMIEPYRFFVLSNREFENGGEYGTYIYPGTLLASRNGYIDLRFGDREVAKATFDLTEQRASLELDRVSNASDGYSSLQNLNPSSLNFRTNLSASPGSSGTTRRLYSREFSNMKWHLISVPGMIDERLNRQYSLRVFNIRGDEVTESDIRAFEPFLMYSEDPSDIRLYIEEQAGRRSEGVLSHINEHATLLSIPAAAPVKVENITNELNSSISPVYLTWDEESSRFKVVFDRETELAPWSPVIVNRDVATPVQASEPGQRSTVAELERFIQFRYLEEGVDRRERLMDEGLLGFVDSRRARSNNRYDLPKFYPFFTEEQDDMPISLMHLSNTLSDLRTNSFTHVPFELDRDYRVGLSITTNKGAVQGVIDWSVMQDIPDEWVLNLEDRQTGTVINMREQNRYRFRMNSPTNIDFEKLIESPFSPVSPTQSDRFVITMKPFESALEVTDDTRPGSVELRQNYPNPFNPATNIVFYLPEERHVRVGIYNVVGQQVGVLLDDNMSAGEHSVSWNASEMPSGIYIVQLETGNRIFTRKITLIK
jgi:hypothetical protein